MRNFACQDYVKYSENLANVEVKVNSVSLLCTVSMRHKELNNKIFLNFPDVTKSLIMRKF